MRTKEATKRDSTWSLRELTKLPGQKQNRSTRRAEFIEKRTRLRRKKAVPTIVNQLW